MQRIQNLCLALKPLIGNQADQLWKAYTFEDDEGRDKIEEYLELLAGSHLHENVQNRTPVFLPPTPPQSEGEFQAGKVVYSQAELHPFLNIFLSLIENIEDKSGALQPRVIWEITQSIQCVFGGNIFFGDHNTEFGGFELFGLDYMQKAQSSAFLWLMYYF